MRIHTRYSGAAQWFLVKCLASAAAAWLLVVMPGPAAALQSLPGHVPAVVSHLTPIGPLPATQSLDLVIGLPLHNLEALTNSLRALYDPASPSYHHWLTPDQFQEQFGPTEADYQKVLDFAQASRLRVTSQDARRRLLSVTAAVGDIEKAFHMTLRTYQHPTEARQFYAPDTEPAVDADVPILSIANLNDYFLPKPCSTGTPLGSAGSPGAPQPLANGSGIDGLYLGSDFTKAYLPNVSYFNGAGHYVGLLEFGQNFYREDVTNYEMQASLPAVPVTAIFFDNYNGDVGTNDGETALDIEVAIAMAPGLAGVRVYEGQFLDSILAAMANDSYVKQFSASWVTVITATSDTYFLQFAMQGQTFFAGSGDYDAYVGQIPTLNENPNLTVVGGTSLTTDTNHNYVSESVWNDRRANTDRGYWGSSGGISTEIPIPSWQTGFTLTASGGSSTNRNIPDVALTAVNVLSVFDGVTYSTEGTSCASPLWAGFMAVANQAAQDAANPSAGFINPLIYSLYKGNDPKTSYANGFNDIITGDNTWPGSTNNFFAVPGYDLCTGLGTPKSGLIAALSGTDYSTVWANDPFGNGADAGTYPSPWSLNYALAAMLAQNGTIVLENGSSSPGAHNISFPVKLHAVGGPAHIGP